MPEPKAQSESLTKFLLENLRYEPDSGTIYWKVPGKARSMSKPVGDRSCDGRYKSFIAQETRVYTHRVAFLLMKGRWPTELDHINRNKQDNRWCNLREVSRTENHLNRGPRSDNKSGVVGVKPCKNGRWRATYKGKELGSADTIEGAAKLRKEAENA